MLGVAHAVNTHHVSTVQGWLILGVVVVLGWFLLRRAKAQARSRAEARAKSTAEAVAAGFGAAVAAAQAAANAHADGGSAVVHIGGGLGGHDDDDDFGLNDDDFRLWAEFVRLRRRQRVADALRSEWGRDLLPNGVGSVSDAARHGIRAGGGPGGPVAPGVPGIDAPVDGDLRPVTLGRVDGRQA